MGRGVAARAPVDAGRLIDGLSRLGARRAPAQAAGDERAAARERTDAECRTMQSRPPDVCRTKARGQRAAVRPAVEHDPEKWKPVYPQDHAPGRSRRQKMNSVSS